MLALCLMLSYTYYAQNYAGIIGLGLDAAFQDDFLVLLVDINARVGVLGPDQECWRDVMGRHGLDQRNKAGEELLQLCAMNQLTVMNIWC